MILCEGCWDTMVLICRQGATVAPLLLTKDEAAILLISSGKYPIQSDRIRSHCVTFRSTGKVQHVRRSRQSRKSWPHGAML